MIVDRIRADIARDDPLWPAQLTALAMISLNFILPDKLSLGPWWLLPALELLMLLVLVARQPMPSEQRSSGHRGFALAFVAIIALTEIVALVLLAHYLIRGGQAAGRELLGAGVIIWATLVLLGAIGYWELDRGGPIRRDEPPEFLFSAMTDEAMRLRPHWTPSFADYLYLSLTNSTAFSPTDTMPLTARAKLVMGVQGVATFATLALIVARAVNILG